ncbi:YopX family protein [Clostridium sp. 001]|uniref:YopX family protein n=1 Tax=Clostridium sp. 001 TaxID=1970093 RepID=UPI001C2CB6C7|nr:YopX family protein [Clostridium sp. 001]QXE19518.1 hypothetical protein B5S50_12185 [Clostridium sp. 001]
MRDVKFRAWDNQSKKMIDWEKLKFDKDPGDNSICFYEKVDTVEWDGGADYEIMQCTGIKDKNGKEIFEGDILGNEKLSTKWAVGFNRGAFVLTSKGVDMGVLHSCSIIDGQIVALKILGNIYENKDLLEG